MTHYGPTVIPLLGSQKKDETIGWRTWRCPLTLGKRGHLGIQGYCYRPYEIFYRPYEIFASIFAKTVAQVRALPTNRYCCLRVR